MSRQIKQGVRIIAGLSVLAATLAWPVAASAQLDPLLMVKRNKPNVVIVVDTSVRMQSDADGNYYDPNDYTKGGVVANPWEAPLGVTDTNTTTKYRRKYMNLVDIDAGAGGDRFTADTIAVVGDLNPAYSNFYAKTRLWVARLGIVKALNDNTGLTRFGLIKTRQSSPSWGTAKNWNPVKVADLLQKTPSEQTVDFKWAITRPTVAAKNGSIAAVQTPLVKADVAGSNTSVVSTLNLSVGAAGALIPAGRDLLNSVDAPVEYMLDDAKAEAARLIAADGSNCRNTVIVLVVGGGEGQTVAGANPATKASQFLNISSRRVPVYVIAIAPKAVDVAQLTAIATNSGGQYFEITKAMIDAQAIDTAVPEVTRAVNFAISHSFMDYADCNLAPAAPLPYGPQTEFQITSPVVGTVDLYGVKDIAGAALPNDRITDPVSLAVIPQHSNMMVTTAFALPGFDGKLRALRMYKPVADTTKPSGFKFVQDGTKLWVATTPAAASRNIYTVTPSGTMTALTSSNASTLAPYMNTTTAEAARIIDYVRTLPIGAFVGSTPAFMDPPSVDPPPDADYPGFIADNKNRRTFIWVGANDGMMHMIDARMGLEVYAFIPFNLLPKLGQLLYGQPVEKFNFFADGSAKIADVRVNTSVVGCPVSMTTCWRTYLFFGEGPGGTFYQALDVTLDNISPTISQTSTQTDLLAYFANPSQIKFRWSFPSYQDFDSTIAPYGDLKATASNIAKTVGDTWSDPAVGLVESATGRYAMLTGSGFMTKTKQAQANRGDVVAGTTFYMLSVDDGTVFDTKDVGSDGLAETVDNCATVPDCTKIKNAIQADVVATGPPDSRYITKAYVGDLDGKVWRFDVAMVSGTPKINTTTNLYSAGAAQPLFNSMATVNVGGTQQYIFFGTGSDLLPSAGLPQNHSYKLLGILDTGATATIKYTNVLQNIDLMAPDEKVTGFPAVAGDIVFFTTTLLKPNTPCLLPDAVVYAATFTGGQAYNGVGQNTGQDAIMTITGARASAPFIADQHVVFAFGNKAEVLGDPEDYNNGVGQVGVRILSWRDVR